MVVHAMLAGIGITIALQQLHVLLGGSRLLGLAQPAVPAEHMGGADSAGIAIGVLVIVISRRLASGAAALRRIPGPAGRHRRRGASWRCSPRRESRGSS